MLTPRFEITQTDSEVTIIVHAPYANIKDVEVYVEGNDFRFYATPYYLRLKLPGEIEENDASSGSYDCEKGDFTLKFSKVNKGEFFSNLDMITSLLAPPKKKTTIVPNIEVIGNPANSEKIDKSSDEENGEQNDTEQSDEWFIPQSVPSENIILPIDSPKYGFANKISGALMAFEPAWIKEIIDLPMPDQIPEKERKALREKKEFEDFDEDHYMADLMEPECVEPYISYKLEWYTLKKEDITLDKDEVDLLKELPNKEYLLNDEEIQLLLCSLVDILYSSCYNHRTTLGDNTVESGWTINKLSSTLCWFQSFSNMNEVINSCIRRSLCYPILRNWDLSMKVFEDVKQVIKLGKKYIIKRFCDIHSLFNNSYEPRYLLNQLYIKDYLIWLQHIPDSLIESLYPILEDIHPNKEDVKLELVELEEAAYSVQKEGLVIKNTVHDIIGHVQNLSIHAAPSDKSSESSSSTDSSDTDSDSESDSSSSTSSNSSLDSDDLTKCSNVSEFQLKDSFKTRAADEIDLTTRNYGKEESNKDQYLYQYLETANKVLRRKADLLSHLLKIHIDRLRNETDEVELVFLVDASGSIGLHNFRSELNFVKKLLAEFTVEPLTTRVAIVTFGGKRNINRNVDQISKIRKDNHKCYLLNKQLNNISYTGGGTYTRGALLEALAILERGRKTAKKVVFLITDGFSNGGDPRPVADLLKNAGVMIFTFGIRTGNVKELHDIASCPGYAYSYFLDSFSEFEALARRALHHDLKTGKYVPVEISSDCNILCRATERSNIKAKGTNCCDDIAICSCGVTTGHYACICPIGFFGSGLRGSCQPCPNGTYASGYASGDSTSVCIPCPDVNHITLKVPATTMEDCICAFGFTTDGRKCEGNRETSLYVGLISS
ncbi:hypothetical protein KPH14_005336 [Odynerus spinipes]|uniref:Protein SHQ1 homolog n=1 Tax=Odynerus spinipes TaxID=1348599 RepID=A0AAD9RBJ3_9HYME|nr:hypothetical protein KPH14_005336 [Odynerus spinipes]